MLLRIRTRELQPVPEGQQLVITPPPIGVAVTFHADEYVVAVEDSAAMLADARQV